MLDLLAQTLKNRGATEFVLSPKEVVAGIPPFKEGWNLPKYIKSFELKLQALKVNKMYWKTLLLGKLPSKIKKTMVELMEIDETC